MGNKPGLQPGLVFSCHCASLKKADTSPEAIPQACALPSLLLTMGLQTFTYGVLSTLLSVQFMSDFTSLSIISSTAGDPSRDSCFAWMTEFDFVKGFSAVSVGLS